MRQSTIQICLGRKKFDKKDENGNYVGYATYDIVVPSQTEYDISITLSAGDIKGSFEALCGDNLVDIDDFIRVMRSFGSMASAIVRNITDIDEDGHPTIEDLSLAKASLSK